MTNHINKRAIDSEELLQIIDNSGGIYESTMVKLLQCNRISLESRLNTLEKNELVSKKKINKKFYYTRKYDIQNIINLDLQSDALQRILDISLYTEYITVIDSPNEKNLFLELFTSASTLNTETNKKINEYRNNTPISKQSFFNQFFLFYTFKVPIVVSSITNINTLYKTKSLENIELLAIQSEEHLLKVIAQLKKLSHATNFEKNESIREDILVYIQELDKIYYFTKSSEKYELNEIKNIIDFIFYLSNYSCSERTVYFSNNKNKFKKMCKLYLKSNENKIKFDTSKNKIGI